jgi:hypothetical protein
MLDECPIIAGTQKDFCRVFSVYVCLCLPIRYGRTRIFLTIFLTYYLRYFDVVCKSYGRYKFFFLFVAEKVKIHISKFLYLLDTQT